MLVGVARVTMVEPWSVKSMRFKVTLGFVAPAWNYWQLLKNNNLPYGKFHLKLIFTLGYLNFSS